MLVKADISYDKGKQIGICQGANSEVFVVNEPQLGGMMVAKEIDKAKFPNPNYFAEAQAMFKAAHPNIVPIQYACDRGTHIVLVMPYYANGSLADRIQLNPLSPKEAIRVTIRFLSGLSHIHAKQCVHLDIKPSNILFSAANEPLLADFGQARALGPRGWVFWPPAYPAGIPPEFYQSGVATQASDVYHVGLLLYRAVNGDPFFKSQVPCDDAERQRLTLAGKFPDRWAFLPHVPKRLRTVIRRALNVDSVDRYQTAVELGKALGAINFAHDWATRAGSNGALTWRAARPGQADLVIELAPAGTRWNVGMFTDGPNGKRAKNSSDHRRDLSRSEADAHLKTVFESF